MNKTYELKDNQTHLEHPQTVVGYGDISAHAKVFAHVTKDLVGYLALLAGLRGAK